MAEKPVAIADRLFREVMAPLVLGGELRPGRPIGAKNALALGPFTETLDKELVSHVDLGRVRAARRLAAVDAGHLRGGGGGGLDGPTPADWALAAVLHDLVQCAHPDLAGLFRGRAPERLLLLASMTLERVAPPFSVADALGRHTWFSRVLEITRTDTQVAFWVGRRTFLGEDPPSRLLVWPELRRVHVDKTPRALLDLPAAGGHVDARRFGEGVTAWLRKTPLTDLATCARATPAFAWSRETLELASTRAGRTLVLRALDELALLDVETALGRATQALLDECARRSGSGDARAAHALAIVTGLLGELALGRAIERAERRVADAEAPPKDASVARAVGAYGAAALLATHAETLRGDVARAVKSQLEPWTRTPAAQAAKTLLGG